MLAGGAHLSAEERPAVVVPQEQDSHVVPDSVFWPNAEFDVTATRAHCHAWAEVAARKTPAKQKEIGLRDVLGGFLLHLINKIFDPSVFL